ncbi:MAG: hypothetical protein OXL41_02475 [Nitrospinae bacterium]|nr:hypothetical protein [Nitrospinota bacterium]
MGRHWHREEPRGATSPASSTRTSWPEAVAAIRLLTLTDTKTGPRTAPLGEAARAVIDALPGHREKDAFLFPRYAEARGQSSLIACWRAVCADAELGRLRLHDLRHTAASQAVMAGENLPLAGLLKNPILARRMRSNRRRRSSGVRFGACGQDWRGAGPSRRLETPKWPTGREEERWRAA